MCVRVPGLASGLRGKAERARREGGVVEVRAQPASSVARPPPDEERRGKGRSKPAGRAHQEPRGGGASGEGEAPPPLFAAVEEESQDPYPLPQTQKRPSPPSPRKQSPAQPRTLAFPNREPQPGRPRLAPPRPAARPSGRRVREELGRELLSGLGHFRGARRVSPPPQDDVDAEEAVAEACCCLAPSPPLNSHPTSGRDGVKRRRRWYFRVALPEPRARPRPLPHPGGTWRTPDSPAGQRPAHLVFLLARTERRARSGALPSGFLLLSGPEAAAYPHCDLEPGT